MGLYQVDQIFYSLVFFAILTLLPLNLLLAYKSNLKHTSASMNLLLFASMDP